MSNKIIICEYRKEKSKSENGGSWALWRHRQGVGKGQTGLTGRVWQILEQASPRRHLGRGLKEEESKLYKHLEEKDARQGIGCARILKYERVW